MKTFTKITLILSVLLVASALVMAGRAVAQDGEPDRVAPETRATAPSLHPTFPLLDKDGTHVLESGAPVSTITTCNKCHDTEFIANHSFHADVGLTNMTEPGETVNGRSWDTSDGIFGKWSPLTYRYLSPAGDENIDMTTAEWIIFFGMRHAGGGPAQYGRDGDLLTALPDTADTVETHIVNPATGELVAWDWEKSGTIEMNCFLCHMPNPANETRKEMLDTGQFQWVNTASLLNTGIVTYTNGRWQWDESAFDENGNLQANRIKIQDPRNENCGLCHGLVHVDAQTPTLLDGCTPRQWTTLATGQIMSPQKIAESGININDKAELRRSWDIHTERIVQCTDCHYSLNNPVFYQELTSSRPDHLEFDPRRIDLGEYLYRPLHDFAKGQSAQGALAPGLDNTMRTCADCHEATTTHEWLPYAERHMTAMACETCHVPYMYAPARQTYDWTVLQRNGAPAVACRGVEEEGETFATSLVNGFEPVLLPRPNEAGESPLSPHNLITSWYWIYGSPERPVAQRDLRSAWLDGDTYHADILAEFDANNDGQLDSSELIIDTSAKETLIANRLQALGLDNPRIAGEVQPYNINHNVTHGEWATKDCQTCHTEDSRMTRPMLLANYVPGGVEPEFITNGSTLLNGALTTNEDGELYFQPEMSEVNLYVLGHNRESHIDILGVLLLMGTFLGVLAHGGMRVVSAKRHGTQAHPTEKVYMYTFYERLWHWLQTAVIFILLFTGLIIHKPDIFGLFSFRGVVVVHNIMAFILVANAALALFYNVVSGEIKQYLPKPQGFFNQMISQTMFYLKGIFRSEPHPFEKTPEQKLNPLQQVTYFGLLNVLLPLQVITGILMWGAQRWPDLANSIGGLTYLAPFHTLISWLLASFIVMHVYLTTTGHTPTANVKAMMFGWDEVETRQETAPAQGD